ncbi:formyltetrahydrofolate deformylase [Frankia sp. CNm7]|uniref:Formyltetrahydrofolate deformylase n=1 Tax=Frankia nepalensis TaxID=1836974 RepID=A0A937RSC9_9ACTN|nr:formyltetrahydrofolate deformylase [Frankia nepalensis]MBL7499350.1 formyltetrahydrofolate deformylase [Frankia nepalensis]MBL7516300.1 formyltetrahydrofolate deformylase [Frankia nepalensis]MBL7519596.1 formyltetrahydrofolate deformylase [Frankia nepalensis]MBL7632469.1 formyltetrahydrofolate deformylase [Frankia nepalensis]
MGSGTDGAAGGARPLVTPAAIAAHAERYRDVGRVIVTCPDRPGIVAAISGLLFRHGANITELQQYSTDPFGGTFFLRIEFHREDLADGLPEIEAALAGLAEGRSMRWRVTTPAVRRRVAIFVSKADHALRELLWRTQTGELEMDVRMVVSNHQDLRDTVAEWAVPFHHVPVGPESRDDAERRALALLTGQVDLVVLARYMQILTPRFLGAFPDRIINIHHSFLPAFVGADPYSAAAQRGVKLIGATAHYVTAELDAGPIIEQDIHRVDHRHSVADLRRIGRHVERAVLARAVGWHLQDRVIVHGNKTIVFA